MKRKNFLKSLIGLPIIARELLKDDKFIDKKEFEKEVRARDIDILTTDVDTPGYSTMVLYMATGWGYTLNKPLKEIPWFFTT